MNNVILLMMAKILMMIEVICEINSINEKWNNYK